MIYLFVTIFLAPLLIAQGLYVRFVTPRLPEPQGNRCGIDGSGPILRLLIIGDSAAAGVGVSTQGQALSGQLVTALKSDFLVYWKLLAQTSNTAKDVLANIEMASPEPFDVVVTSVGVNDVTHGTALNKWIYQKINIIGLLQSKFCAQQILLSSLPPMHHFPALPQPLRWYLGIRAKRFNMKLKKIADEYGRCEFVSINLPLQSKYMAADGFHPGALAYSLWANHIAGIIRNRLDVNVLMKGKS
jgi:lysophospholipase L1-like esterase